MENVEQQIGSLRTDASENHKNMMMIIGGTAYNTMKALILIHY